MKQDDITKVRLRTLQDIGEKKQNIMNDIMRMSRGRYAGKIPNIT